ncbi:hypothetical protein JCM19238_4876 [Vibrio ponticus]|nr:hypothetical protein JCM19238_4876 [Vibrio ponticus]
MKKQLTIAILSALACSSAYASWGKVTATFDTLTDTITDGAKDAWDSTKEFSQQA